eukprot:GHVN01067086.1.p1 GENE.GHVN01067086.1~~GHVN01067086.1.p1  ORF type:complete len:740 (-),score=101.47 GHVN01067086.1:16-2235(-)
MVVTYSIKFTPPSSNGVNSYSNEGTSTEHGVLPTNAGQNASLEDSETIPVSERTPPPSTSSAVGGDGLGSGSNLTDIEDLSLILSDHDERSSMAPIDKFSKKNKISVTDLSAQLWCERQLEFVLTTGKRRETAAMRAGTARHEVLETADHEVVEVEVFTKEDNLGLRLLNSVTLFQQLLDRGKAREAWVFGIVNGILIRGVIDELDIRSNPRGVSELWISDTKTRRKCEEPSGAQKRTSAIQLQMYCHIVNEMRRGATDYRKMIEIFEVDPLKAFECQHLHAAGYQNLEELVTTFRDFVENRLPPVHQEMEIVYECDGHEFARNLIPFSDSTTMYTVEELLDWWHGCRPADGVLSCESWKCNYCDFVGECTATPLQPEKIAVAVAKQEAEREEERLAEERAEQEKANNELMADLGEDQLTPLDGGHDHESPRGVDATGTVRRGDSSMCQPTSKMMEIGTDKPTSLRSPKVSNCNGASATGNLNAVRDTRPASDAISTTMMESLPVPPTLNKPVSVPPCFANRTTRRQRSPPAMVPLAPPFMRPSQPSTSQAIKSSANTTHVIQSRRTQSIEVGHMGFNTTAATTPSPQLTRYGPIGAPQQSMSIAHAIARRKRSNNERVVAGPIPCHPYQPDKEPPATVMTPTRSNSYVKQAVHLPEAATLYRYGATSSQSAPPNVASFPGTTISTHVIGSHHLKSYTHPLPQRTLNMMGSRTSQPREESTSPYNSRFAKSRKASWRTG